LEVTREPILSVNDLWVFYGHVRALRGVSLDVYEGEIVTIIGANGAGKSTLLESVMGLHKPSRGRTSYLGRDITHHVSASTLVAEGMCLVPEGRGIVPGMSVLENLQLGSQHLGRGAASSLAEVMERFPILANRRRQKAGSLSGGEQQMLVIARALAGKPKLLLLDEPSLGLSPLIVSEVFNMVAELKATGYSVLLAEQNARKALQIADRAYVFETGEMVLTGHPADIVANPLVQQAYLGGI
jgi:branched-chain amino acid transport system ATP-binding protein